MNHAKIRNSYVGGRVRNSLLKKGWRKTTVPLRKWHALHPRAGGYLKLGRGRSPSAVRNEIDFVRAITRKPVDRNVLVGIGDDASVIRIPCCEKLMLLTADMFVENDHFSLSFSEPEDIGVKVIEANVSDISAMGGEPKYALVSISLRKGISIDFVKRLYSGMHSSCRRHGVDIIGGDTTHGTEINISISMVGFAEEKNLCLRRNAKEGDIIMVSGDIGTSSCGLELFRKKIPGFEAIKKFHRQPLCHLKESRKIRRWVNAMEDVSDGLASEVRNICIESRKGAIIYRNLIPVREDVRKASALLCKEPTDFALFGGEDFRLVFTVSKKNYPKVKSFGTVVGKITNGRKIILAEENGEKKELTKFGYDHFARTKV